MASEVLHSPAVRGAVSGVLAAAVVDLHAFLGWKNVEEFASYSWGTAALRWMQGAISGALAGAGFGAFS